MGVIAAPNLTPIYQHPNKTPVDSTEPKFMRNYYRNKKYSCKTSNYAK